MHQARPDPDPAPDEPGAPEPADARPPIRVRGLYKSFDTQHVLAGLDFEIAPGEILVVLGPSGSGKTTLLRLLAGLQQPDRGSIELHGRPAEG